MHQAAPGPAEIAIFELFIWFEGQESGPGRTSWTGE